MPSFLPVKRWSLPAWHVVSSLSGSVACLRRERVVPLHCRGSRGDLPAGLQAHTHARTHTQWQRDWGCWGRSRLHCAVARGSMLQRPSPPSDGVRWADNRCRLHPLPTLCPPLQGQCATVAVEGAVLMYARPLVLTPVSVMGCQCQSRGPAVSGRSRDRTGRPG